MLVRNKEMIPNFKLAEKILNKAKKKSPLGIAVEAAIIGDARAGKPNASKAEKMFKDAMKQSSKLEIKELYAGFLKSEDRESEIKQLGVDVVKETSSRLRRSTLSVAKNFTTKGLSTTSQLADGKELYYEGFKKHNDSRYLERAAAAGFPLVKKPQI